MADVLGDQVELPLLVVDGKQVSPVYKRTLTTDGTSASDHELIDPAAGVHAVLVGVVGGGDGTGGYVRITDGTNTKMQETYAAGQLINKPPQAGRIYFMGESGDKLVFKSDIAATFDLYYCTVQEADLNMRGRV